MPPSWGAGALLHPSRRLVQNRPTRPVDELSLEGEGVSLRAWWFRSQGRPRRGTVVYLHGIADSRGSGIPIADRFVPKGFDVIAYDSRAHGDSTGEACTYGYYEKRDLSRVLDKIEGRPIVLFGTSLGAAVALQAAAEDERVAAVIAVETFSDLRTVANERAPFFASQGNIEDAFQIVQKQASFDVDAVSPVAAGARIRAPVLVIHGEKDRETPPDHSRRVYAALRSPKRLIIVPSAAHNDCLKPEVWRQIDEWLEATLGGRSAGLTIARCSGRSSRSLRSLDCSPLNAISLASEAAQSFLAPTSRTR